MSTGEATTYDVAVVGAGPAGAAAARAAALAGARTVLLERAPALPRYKTCGGGLIGLSRLALPVPVAALARDTADRLTVTLDGRRPRTRGRVGSALLPLVDRADLDLALVQAAVRAGAELRTGSTLLGISEPGNDGPVELRLRDGLPLRAAVVVGADGSAGRTSVHVGVRSGQVDLGLEAEVPIDAATADRWRGRVLLDWGPVPGSYGWVFPKGDVLTVGVIGDRSSGPALRGYYRRLLARHGLAEVEPLHDTGHLTRCREPGSPLRRGRVLVAGDAAGLLDPWTREGISCALRSGTLAGRAAAAGSERALASYAGQVEATLGAEMTAGRRFLDAFARRPAAFHAAMAALPGGWTLMARVVAGDVSLASLVRRPTVRAVLRTLTS